MSIFGGPFGELFGGVLGGDVTINGNLTVTGDLDSSGEVTKKDNLIVLNDGEVGSGVTGGVAGLEIDRGLLTNYQIIFDESDDTFKAGQVGSLQSLAFWASAPTEGYLAFGGTSGSYSQDSKLFWNNSTKALGVGLATPQSDIHISDVTAGIQLTNPASGETSSDGLLISQISDNTSIINRESGFMFLGSSGGTALTIDSSNNLGVGGVPGAFKLDVTGAANVSTNMTVGGDLTITGSTFGSHAQFTGFSAPSSGKGIEFYHASGVAYVAAHDRDVPEYEPLVLRGKDFYMQVGTGVSTTNAIQIFNNLDVRSYGDKEATAIGTAGFVMDGGLSVAKQVIAGTKLGIGAAPDADFDCLGHGRFLSDSLSIPTTGKGLEIFYDSGEDLARFLSFDRTSPAYKNIAIDGLTVSLRPLAIPRLEITPSDMTLSIDSIKREVNTSLVNISGSTSNASGSARVSIYGSSHATLANQIQNFGSTILWSDQNVAERMRLDSTGLGIGKTPSYKLDVNGIMNCTGVYENGSPIITSTLWDSNTAADAITPAATFDDYVGIGITAPWNNLHIHESTASTDVRLKLTNAGHGSADLSGFDIVIDGTTLDTNLINRNNQPMSFFTNNTKRLEIEDAGNVIVSNTLEVDDIRIIGGGTGFVDFDNNGAHAITFSASGGYLNPSSSFNAAMSMYYNAPTGGIICQDFTASEFRDIELIGKELIFRAGLTSSVERARIDASGYLRLAGAGIQFNGDTADANSLDDYEEGTWTPTLPNGGTLTVESALYTKIGNTVTVSCYLSSVNPTNNSSDMLIGGIPYTAAGSGAIQSASLGYCGDSNLDGWVVALNPGAVSYNLYIQTGDNVPRTNANYLAAATGSLDRIIFNMTYFV